MAKIIAFYVPSHFQKKTSKRILVKQNGKVTRVQLSKKEVGLSAKAIGLSQALFDP